jgi:hypothetical protein
VGTAGDDAVVADDGVPAEDDGSGVDRHAIADGRVALEALDGPAAFVFGEATCTQGNALVHLDVRTDDGGLADDGG